MTKETICKRLHRIASVPKTMVFEYAAFRDSLPEFPSIVSSFKKQLEVTNVKNMSNTQIFFLTGNKSTKKNLLMTCLLAESIQQNVTTSYTTGQSIIENKVDYPILSRVFAIDDADLISKQDFKVINLTNFILKIMKNNGILIISCLSLDSIKDILGDDIMGFLSSYSLNIFVKHDQGIVETTEV